MTIAKCWDSLNVNFLLSSETLAKELHHYLEVVHTVAIENHIFANGVKQNKKFQAILFFLCKEGGDGILSMWKAIS